MSNSGKHRVPRNVSNLSAGSTASTGIGCDIGNYQHNENLKEDLPPNLTPEGLSVDPNLRIYDSIVYLIYCPEHDKIAVTNVERARCVWFPFVYLNENQTWMQASRNGLDLIIGRKDAEMDAEESAKKAPVYSISYLNILRIQLPPEKFITRLTMLVILKKSLKSTFQCCQRSMRINWIRACDILADRIDKIWGPELKSFTKLLNGEKKQTRRLINEFSLEHSCYHYFTSDNSPEKKLIKASHIKIEYIAEIFENFVEHCYPSFYMSYESFKQYLIKYGFDRKDPRLPFLFRACSIYDNDFLHFHEVLLGIIAMEPTTKHFMEGRLNFIFKYYDTSNNGYLKLEEFIVLVTDIYKQMNENFDEDKLRTMIEESIRCVGMKDEKISKDNFIKAILSNTFKNTEILCRSPKPILTQISRLMQTKNEQSRSSLQGFLLNRRTKKGSCIHCRDQNYEYGLNCVTLDTIGRCVKPTIISEQWIEPAPKDEINQHKYSIEYVFNNNSVPNIFIDLIKDFYNKTKIEVNQQQTAIGLMSLREDWAIFSRYLTILCSDLKGLLMAEDKLIKINSPAIVVGDLQGSLQDLFALEKIYLHSFPVIANNIIFLGNFSGLCSYGVEVITYLFSLKLLSPNKIFLLRGTNEMSSKSKQILKKECLHKYGEEFGKKIFAVIHEIFVRLPFAIIIDENIFCCHSGIPKWTKIDKLYQLGHDVFSVIKEASIAYELLVNTPLGLENECLCKTSKETSKNKSLSSNISHKSSKSSKTRQLGVTSVIGVTGFTATDHSNYLNSCSFDGIAFNNFMRSNNFSFFIRSHNVINNEDGFDIRFGNRCITIFSCSLKSQSNKCTVAFVDGSNQQIRLLSFETECETSIPVRVDSLIAND